MKNALLIFVLMASTIGYAVSIDFKTLYADHISDLEVKSFSGSVEYQVNFSGQEMEDLFNRLPEVRNLSDDGPAVLKNLRKLEIFKGDNENAKRIFIECEKANNTTNCQISFAEGVPAG